MARIILIRHGETEWNREERFRGRADLALTELGMRQAGAIAVKLAQWPVAAIYSSPLRRAMMTAQAQAQHLGVSVEVLPGLADIDYGKWQGLTPLEASQSFPESYGRWLEAPHLVQIPGGDSLAQVRERAWRALHDVVAQWRQETVAMVSHMVVCRLLLCAALGLDDSHFWQVEQDVGAINVLETRNELLTVTLINDTCHLKGVTQ